MDFLDILRFLRQLPLKDKHEKEEFFENLVPRLQALPVDVVARRLVTPLLARFVLLEESAVKHVILHLLTPATGSTETPTMMFSTQNDVSMIVHCTFFVCLENSGSDELNAVNNIHQLLPPTLFQRYVIPEITKIFHVRDLHVRLVLLCHFSRYCHLFERDVLLGVVVPQVSTEHGIHSLLVQFCLFAAAARTV